MENVQLICTPSRHYRLSIHGIPVELRCEVPSLNPTLGDAFGEFASENSSGTARIQGAVSVFEEHVVLKHVSPTAKRVTWTGPALELYEEGERFWIVDESWGLAEINLLKGQWQSWILPRAAIAVPHVVEQAIQWPLAQLLRLRGLTMIPAASVVRGDLGMLIIAPFKIDAELIALHRAGFKIVGQQWSALRMDSAGRISMLYLPGRADFMHNGCCAIQHRASAHAVLLVDRGRRAAAQINPIPSDGAQASLRSAWPVVELHPPRRHSQMSVALAQQCSIFQCQLSREPQDILALVAEMRAPSPKVRVTMNPMLSALVRARIKAA